MGKGSTKNTNYDRESLLYRLHRARLIIVGIVLLSIGIVLTLTVHGKIAEDFASTLINMGTIGIFGDFAARVIAEARVVELFKKLMRELASGPYRSMIDKMRRAPEERHDARIDVTLTASPDHSDMFTVVVRCEHRTTTLKERHFICSPKEALRERSPSGVIAEHWIINHSMPADDPGVFTLQDYAINGERQPIRRSTHNGTQTYAVAATRQRNSSPDGMHHVAYTYKTLVPRRSQWLKFTINVPTNNFSLTLTQFETDINRLSVLDFFASAAEPRVNHGSAATPAPISVSVDGWIMPTSGVAIDWSLNNPALVES